MVELKYLIVFLVNLFNLKSFFLFSLFILLLNFFFSTNNLQKKFFSFFILFLILNIITFYYNLDGLSFLTIISEFSVILVLTMLLIYIKNYNNHTNNNFETNYLLLFTMLSLNYQFYGINIIKYNSFYCFCNIVSNDFYFFYNIFFEKEAILCVLIILLITIYSVFFVFYYIFLKKYNNLQNNIKKKIYVLRKQNTHHQFSFDNKARVFNVNCFKKIVFQSPVIPVEFF